MTLAAIAFGAAVVRIVYVLAIARHVELGLDSTWYVLVANQLAVGQGYVDPARLLGGVNEPTANFPPLYAAWLAALRRFGVMTPEGLQLAGAFTGTATVVLTGLLARTLLKLDRPALVAAAIVAASPAVVAADGSLMSETVALALLVACLLVTCANLRRPAGAAHWWRWLGAGVLGGLAALARAELLLVAVVLAPAIVLVAHRARRMVGVAVVAVPTALLVAGAFAVVAPWLVRNERTIGAPVLSTNGEKTLAGAHCDRVYGGDLVGLWDVSCIGEHRRVEFGERRYAATLRREAVQYISDHTARAPVVAGIRLARAWGLYRPDQQIRWEAVETRSIGWQRAAWAGSLAMLAAAIAGLFRARPRGTTVLVVTGPALLASAVAAATNGNQRMVLVAVPGLASAAAMLVRPSTTHPLPVTNACHSPHPWRKARWRRTTDARARSSRHQRAARRPIVQAHGMSRPSIYEAAGGEPAFLALATAHHARCLADPVLNHPFSHPGHPQHVERLAAYWAEVLGGPPSFSQTHGGDQPAMLGIHAHNGAGTDIGERFFDCFVKAIDDAGLPEDEDLRAALRAYMEWAVADVMRYAPREATVPGDLTVPRWSWHGPIT